MGVEAIVGVRMRGREKGGLGRSEGLGRCVVGCGVISTRERTGMLTRLRGLKEIVSISLFSSSDESLTE